jgi:chloramphenicol 3-O-phosphotransferase
MRLVFLYGLPATGKLSIGRELAALTGYKLFHNHLAVDLLLSVFDFGSPDFVELRESIWLSVIGAAASQPGLIFTFAPESTVRPRFVPNLMELVERNRGEILFVELTCPLNELKNRMESSSRLQFQKLASVPLFEQLYASGVFDSAHMPTPAIRIDTSTQTPAEAAANIARQFNLT